MLTREMFMIFTNFCQIYKIKSSQKNPQVANLQSLIHTNFFSFHFSEFAKLTVVYQLKMVMSKIFYKISNNTSRDNIEQKM